MMNGRLFLILSMATLLSFGIERYTGWYNPDSALNTLVGTKPLRILFFALFSLQTALALQWYVKDHDNHIDGLPGVLLFASIVAAALAFCLYDVPLHALNLIVRLLAPCFR